MAPVGVFGGTFNPVHYGHLRSALELVERLQLTPVATDALCSAAAPGAARLCRQHRAAMVELAVAGEPRIGLRHAGTGASGHLLYHRQPD